VTLQYADRKPADVPCPITEQVVEVASRSRAPAQVRRDHDDGTLARYTRVRAWFRNLTPQSCLPSLTP
jgi:hypothetical protein